MNIQMDLRNLQAPEATHRILDALDLLQPGQKLEALSSAKPASLLPMLDHLGYGWELETLSGGSLRTTIWRRDGGSGAVGPSGS